MTLLYPQYWLNHIWLVEPTPLKHVFCSQLDSVGMMTFPIEGKIEFMFQITKQITYCSDALMEHTGNKAIEG